MQEVVFTQLSIPEVKNLIRGELESFFSNRADTSTPKSTLPDLGGIALAVEVTGLKRPTLYALVQRRGIPFMKKGKMLYFKRAELEAWIESGRKPTTADIEAQVDSLKIGKGKKKGTKQ